MEYFETGLVERFPTLIVSGVLAMIGILLWVCGCNSSGNYEEA